MKQYLTWLIAGLVLSLSGNAFAHSAGFVHPMINSGFFHMLFHYMTVIGLGVGMFYFSRWLIRRNQR